LTAFSITGVAVPVRSAGCGAPGWNSTPPGRHWWPAARCTVRERTDVGAPEI
jgi:hypothetical protein